MVFLIINKMADEIIAPLMASTDNSEESESSNSSKNEYNDNELANLIENNNADINNNNRNNINQNVSHKKGLIYLSYAIQVLIYIILLDKYYDKIEIIKNNYNILFYLSLFFIILLSLKHLRINEDLREMNIYLEIILAIISSIFMYFFLYKLVVILTFKFFKSITLVTFPMYLFLSLLNFYSYFIGNFPPTSLFNISVLGSWLFVCLLCIIFYLLKIIDSEFAVNDLYVAIFLNFISIIHTDLIFKGINIRFKHYPILHVCLFIDIFILSLFNYFLYILEKNKKNEIKYV